MKFVIDLDLDDILEAEVEYEDYDREEPIATYRFKDSKAIKEEVEKQIKSDIARGIRYDSLTIINNSIKEIVNSCKEEIVSKVVDKVSKSIINTKMIKDFKKSLEVE